MASPLHSNSARQKLLDELKKGAPVDAEMKDLLLKYSGGFIKTQDGTIKSIRQANAVGEIQLFDPTDEKRTGIYSLSKGQLEKDQIFLVTHIGIRAYAAVTNSGGNPVPATLPSRQQEEYNAMLAADSFGCISLIPALANGECELRVNRKPLINKLSNQVFVNLTDSTSAARPVGKMGVHRLENTILIKPQVPIEMTLRLPVATPASTLIEVIFYGAQTLAA